MLTAVIHKAIAVNEWSVGIQEQVSFIHVALLWKTPCLPFVTAQTPQIRTHGMIVKLDEWRER